MGILIPLIVIAFCGYIIWRAGDSFVEGSNYIGRNLSEGVKGATINAVASSMPELFIAMFFLFYLKDNSGFSGSLGTSLGSVIFNSLIIPSVAVYNVILFSKKDIVPVSKKVILRDGLWLLAVEILLIVIIKDSIIDWLDGLLLLIIYALYLFYIFKTMKGGEKVDYDFTLTDKEKVSFLSAFFVFDLRAMLIGNKKLNTPLAWFLFGFSSLVIGLVCYFLVIACDWLGSETYSVPYLGDFYGLNTPILFIALIFAAIGSSFPDTIISIKDAKDGNYDDAVSNAYGSNIFNLCIALGIPLFLYTTIYDTVIELDKRTMEMIFKIWIWFVGLTVVSIYTYYFGKGINKTRSVAMVISYIVFIVYVFFLASSISPSN